MLATSRPINQRYTILQDCILGKGSTGYVYLGFETANHTRKVAIKAIDMKQIDNEVTKYLLSCQITALSELSKIQHPGRQHIVRLIEVASHEDHIYLITQLLQGGTLAEYMKRYPNGLSPSETLTIFRQIVKGYQHIRNKNIIHRDLKPDNILFKIKPQLRKDVAIIDFGYCDMAEVGNKPQMFYNVGSPKYMSPEAYEDNIYTEKSDIWALGVILYQLLIGRTCDQGLSMQTYLDMLKNRGVIYPQSLHPYFRELLQNMLCVSQHQRFNTSQVIQKLNEAQFHFNHSNVRQNQVFQSVLISPMSRLASQQVKNSLIQFRNSGSPDPHFAREENMLECSPQKKLIKCDSVKVVPLFTFNSQKKQELGIKVLEKNTQRNRVFPKPLINNNRPDYFPNQNLQRAVLALQPNKIATSKNIRFNIANNQAPNMRSQYGFQNTPKKTNIQRIDRFTTQPILKDQNCIRIHIKGNGPQLNIKNLATAGGSSLQKQPNHHFAVMSPERGDLTDRRRVRFDNTDRKLVGGFTIKDKQMLNTQKIIPQPVFFSRPVNPMIVQQTIVKTTLIN